MTLDEVMRLSCRELDERVAERIGRCPHPHNALVKWVIEDGNDYDSGFRCTKCGKGDIYGDTCPDFCNDWSAAMQIREWARGLNRQQQRAFLNAVERCAERRLGPYRRGWILLDAEPEDYARAALLVEG